MSSEDDNLDTAFNLIEEAEENINNYNYNAALINLHNAFQIFEQSTTLGSEKQQALAMIEKRIENLEKMIEKNLTASGEYSESNQSLNRSPLDNQVPNKSFPSFLRPPPVFGKERTQLIKLGLKALANSEDLMNQGYLYRAYKSILYAYSHLTQAQYDSTKITNIYKVIQIMAQKLQNMGYNLQDQEQTYKPSFLSTGQPDYVPTSLNSPYSSQVGENLPGGYKPTFLTTDQIDYSPISSSQKAKENNEMYKPYVPTFAQTNQLDFTETSKTRIPYSHRTSFKNDQYQPTFTQTDQTDYIPSDRNKRKTARRTISETDSDEFLPTFAKVSDMDNKTQMHEEEMINLSELQTMFSFIEKGEPIPDTLSESVNSQTSKNLGNINESAKNISSLKVEQPDKSQNSSKTQIATPFIHPKNSKIIEPSLLKKWGLDLKNFTQKQFEEFYSKRQHDLELNAQELLDSFEKFQETQKKKQDTVLKYIDLIHSLEKTYDYEGAISALYKAIGKMNKLLGWADQVLVLYAWMLILKEKQRTKFRLGGNPSDFDLMRINTEFVQIMTDSLNTSKEVAISFIGDDFNQELNAHQIYKAKLEEQEELENTVFELLDTANLKIINEQYAQAIGYYNRAILALNSLDWAELRQKIEHHIQELSDLQQLKDLSLVIELNPNIILQNLKKSEYSSSQLTQFSSISPCHHSITQTEDLLKYIEQESTIREERINELKKYLQQQADQKYHAFSLISQGEGLVLSDLFDEAIEAYEESIKILIEAGWEEQIAIMTDRLVKIRQIREEFIHNKQEQYDQMFKRNLERRNFEDSIIHGITNELQQYQLEKHSKTEIQAKQEDLNNQKEKIFNMLSEVESKAEKNQLAEAILQLKKVKSLLQAQNWDKHLSFIYDFVSMVQDQKKAQDLKAKLKAEQKEEIERFKQKIQSYLDEQADKLLRSKDRKYKILNDFQNHVKQEISLAYETLSLLKQAQTHLNRNEFHVAIDLYEEADLNFVNLGWNINMQECIYLAHQKEKEFTNSISKYEHSAHLQKEAEIKSQYSQQKKEKHEQSALSEIQNLLSSMHGKSTLSDSDLQKSSYSKTTQPSLEEKMNPAAQIQKLSASTMSKSSTTSKTLTMSKTLTTSKTSTVLNTTIENSSSSKISESKKTPKSIPDSIEELQRMIREAAEKDKKK
ncbi:hypothetical protein [Candidatus Harpocratesius sp.]